jgi:hypothetical protein
VPSVQPDQRLAVVQGSRLAFRQRVVRGDFGHVFASITKGVHRRPVVFALSDGAGGQLLVSRSSAATLALSGGNVHPEVSATAPAVKPITGKGNECRLVAEHETEQIGHIRLPH